MKEILTQTDIEAILQNHFGGLMATFQSLNLQATPRGIEAVLEFADAEAVVTSDGAQVSDKNIEAYATLKSIWRGFYFQHLQQTIIGSSELSKTAQARYEQKCAEIEAMPIENVIGELKAQGYAWYDEHQCWIPF